MDKIIIKEKQIEKLKDKMETWKSELFDKLEEIEQIIYTNTVEIFISDTTKKLLIIETKEFEEIIDELINKFTI